METIEGKCKVIVRVRPLLENEPKLEAVTVDTEKNTVQVSLLDPERFRFSPSLFAREKRVLTSPSCCQ